MSRKILLIGIIAIIFVVGTMIQLFDKIELVVRHIIR